jgi:hypothetical protein
MGTGQISIDVGQALIDANKALIEAFAVEVMEERLAILERQFQERPPAARISVIGGHLGQLPGCDVIMPQLDAPQDPGPWANKGEDK